jgi:subtilisin family serine protease
MHHVRLAQGMSMEEALEAYQNDPDVEYAEPNYVRRVSLSFPDDPDFGRLWGLDNTGQTGGSLDADINAPEAWDTHTGSKDVVVAVLDTGVDWNHEDLTDNIWASSDEVIGDDTADGFPGIQGIDDDKDGLIDEDSQGRQPGEPGYTNDLKDDDDENGYVDDIRGWDFVNGDNDPDDDNDHGTHVSGTIGAKGDNGTGITGVNWSVSIMPLKMLNANGNGSVAGEIEAINYAIDKEAKIINASFTGSIYSVLEYEAVEMARDAGILFVAAAGNTGTDNDSSPKYPASYNLDNVIAVAATDHNDALASFSNYGATSVDVAAPGTNIHSTKTGNAYQDMAGTSMATPHVSGLAALIWAEDLSKNGNFTLTYDQVKDRILNSVDLIPALTGQLLTAGRINAERGIDFSMPAPDAPTGLAANASSGNQIHLTWTDSANATTISGGPYSFLATVALDVESYIDITLNEVTAYYYRVVAVNAGGTAASDEVEATTPLSAPTDLSADPQSSSRIDLRWTDNSAVESGYKIEEEAGAGGTFTEIAEVGPNVQRYSRTGLSASTTYTYRVRAFKGNDFSDYSNEARDGTLAASAINGASSSGGSGGGGGGGGCFIQTATPR